MMPAPPSQDLSDGAARKLDELAAVLRTLDLQPPHLDWALAVASSALFDAGHYRASHEDARATRLHPALHFAMSDPEQCRNPGPGFDTRFYIERSPDLVGSGLNGFVHYLLYGAAEGRPARAVPDERSFETAAPSFASRRDFPVPPAPDLFRAPDEGPRVTLVTDGLDRAALLDEGVGGLALAVMLARRHRAGLRIHTRSRPPDAATFAVVNQQHRLSWSRNVDFGTAANPDAGAIPAGNADLFVTTSWAATAALLQVVSATRIIVLLARDERAEAQPGDERLRCGETLATPGLTHVVQGSALAHHLASGPTPLVVGHGSPVVVDPVLVPADRSEAVPPRSSSRRLLLCYADVARPRSLFWRSVEAISAALRDEVLVPAEWDVAFVGPDGASIGLPGDLRPMDLAEASWADLVATGRQVSIGLRLDDAPYETFSPHRALTASGILVSGRPGPASGTSRWDDVVTDLSAAGLVEGLRVAKTRLDDRSGTLPDPFGHRQAYDWQEMLLPVVKRLFPIPGLA